VWISHPCLRTHSTPTAAVIQPCGMESGSVLTPCWLVGVWGAVDESMCVCASTAHIPGPAPSTPSSILCACVLPSGAPCQGGHPPTGGPPGPLQARATDPLPHPPPGADAGPVRAVCVQRVYACAVEGPPVAQWSDISALACVVLATLPVWCAAIHVSVDCRHRAMAAGQPPAARSHQSSRSALVAVSAMATPSTVCSCLWLGLWAAGHPCRHPGCVWNGREWCGPFHLLVSQAGWDCTGPCSLV
jgi:hypothetical protein